MSNNTAQIYLKIRLRNTKVAKGVPVDSQNDSGTPWIWAAGHDQNDAEPVLLEHNADSGKHPENYIKIKVEELGDRSSWLKRGVIRFSASKEMIKIRDECSLS
ncbi:hypothetical protein Bca101_100102 [Brassica carinata]